MDVGDTVTRLGGHGSTNVGNYVGRRRFNFARERPRIRGWKEDTYRVGRGLTGRRDVTQAGGGRIKARLTGMLLTHTMSSVEWLFFLIC